MFVRESASFKMDSVSDNIFEVLVVVRLILIKSGTVEV